MTDHRPTSVPPPPTMQVPAYEVWQPPSAPPRRRVPGWIIAVAVGTAIASVGAFVAVLMWPAGGRHVAAGPLEFHGFAQINRVAFDEPSRTTFAAVDGDRGFAAWEQGGDLRLVSFDVVTGEEHWREGLTGVPQWGRLIATPKALLVLEHQSSTSEPRSIFARDPESGGELWRTEVRGEDRLIITDQTLVVLDRDAESLRGLDWVSGTTQWTVQFEGTAQAFGVTTPAGLARPTDPRGVNLSHPDAMDNRIVLLTADRLLRVIDGRDGGTLDELPNLADPADDLLVAHNDRLFVAAHQGGYRVEAYNLEDLLEPPRIAYTAPDPERYPDSIMPCGQGRVCLLDSLRFDDSSMAAVAVDTEAGGELWRTPVPGAQRAIPVGDWLLVNAEEGFNDPRVTVLDSSGSQLSDPQPGVGVRLNDGNLLLFGAALDSGDTEIRAAGVAIEVGQPVELGRLPAVDPERCSWNDRFVVCAGRDGAEVWRFAADD